MRTKRLVRQVIRHGFVGCVLLAFTFPTKAADIACLVADKRLATDLGAPVVGLACEGGRYRAGLVESGAVWRGKTLDGDDMVIVATAIEEGAIVVCSDAKRLPREWVCSLQR